MDIQRINTYNDNQFSKAVLLQHGCFLVDGKPYEVEIISDYEAIIRGENQAVYAAVIGEFRFYTPHITQFYDKDGKKVMEYPRLSPPVFGVNLITMAVSYGTSKQLVNLTFWLRNRGFR